MGDEPGRPIDRAGVIAALALGSVYAVVAALRVHNRWAGALDLGVFDQGLWLLSNGRAPEVTVIGDNLFADHLSLVLLLFVPLYRVAASPYWFVVIQAFAVALTILPLRAIARDLELPPWIGTAAVVASAPLLAATIVDFHPLVLAIPAVAWAVLAASRDDTGALTWATIAIAIVRADAVWILVGVAVIAGNRCRRRIAVLVPPILLVALVTPLALDTSRQHFGRLYASLGDTPADAATHPWRVLTTLVSEPALKTFSLWLLPVGFIIVLKPRWLAAVALAGAPFLLSSIPGVAQPWFYYSGVLMPLVVSGAMAVVAEPRLRLVASVLWLTATVVALALVSPLSPNAPGNLQLATFVRPRDLAGFDEALARVRPEDSVSADFDLLTSLVHRDRAYVLPCPFENPPDEQFCARLPASTPAVDVVITRPERRDLLVRHGYAIDELPGGRLIVGHR